MKQLIIIATFFLLTTPVFARIRLNIDIVDTIGGDRGLVLVSELHSMEIADDHRVVKVIMKNGLRVEFAVYYVLDTIDYGPSAKVNISAKIYQDETLLKSFDENGGALVDLGAPMKIVYNGSERQIVEITVVPESL